MTGQEWITLRPTHTLPVQVDISEKKRRLYEAAPEMLAVLTAIRDRILACKSESDDEAAERAAELRLWERLWVVIEKAEGR